MVNDLPTHAILLLILIHVVLFILHSSPLGGKTKDVGPTMLTDGTRNIIYSMKQNNIKRVSIVTSIGAGDSENQVCNANTNITFIYINVYVHTYIHVCTY